MTQHRAVTSPALPLALAPADDGFVLTANANPAVLRRNKDAQVFLVVRHSL
ncbi:MAG TPA: hypothetical protein VF736_21750 [Pyrinomonadaceae bacterium]